MEGASKTGSILLLIAKLLSFPFLQFKDLQAVLVRHGSGHKPVLLTTNKD